MKSLLAFLLLSCGAYGQGVYYVQCGPGGCGGGACQPRYYYQQPQYSQPQQQRPSPDGVQTPQVGSPNTPKFQPLPPPPPVTTPAIPPQPGPQGPPGPPGKDGKDATCECGPKWDSLDKRLASIELSITEIKNQAPPTPVIPAQPQAEEHVVVVADHNAPYWRRLAEALNKTRQTYKGVRDTTLPEFAIGVHPQAVVYRNSVPVRVVKGQYQVEDLLARLSRGDSI